MTTKTRTSIETDIKAIVLAKGFTSAAVVRQTERSQMKALEVDTSGLWYLLFVDGQLWGRRRTLDELLQLAERGPVENMRRTRKW